MSTYTNNSNWIDAKEKSLNTIKRNKELRIEKYNDEPKRCLNCNNSFNYFERHKKFCNHSCSASYNNKLVKSTKSDEPTKDIIVSVNIEPKYCFCGKKIEPNRIFCSRSCNIKHIKDNNINYWLNYSESMKILPAHVRLYLLEQNNNACSVCNWSEKNMYSNTYPLVIDHIDGNSENNKPNNLRVLCPNCDSLTSTYKSLNKGNGRAKRRLRYNEGKSY